MGISSKGNLLSNIFLNIMVGEPKKWILSLHSVWAKVGSEFGGDVLFLVFGVVWCLVFGVG